MPRAPMPRPTAWRRAALAALFMAFALTALAPDNAAAQATSLDLGTVAVDVNGTDTNININLIRPITTSAAFGSKLYYYLDPDNSNTPNSGDSLTHDVLNALLNGGSDTIDTQTTGTGHDGSDDERSVIVGSYALILPTLAEWRTLHSDRNPVSLSPRWPGSDFHTATLASPASHNFFRLDTGGSSTGSRGSLYRVAFQVITPIRPRPPTGVTLTPGDGQIEVMWTAVPDADNGGADITEYRVRYFGRDAADEEPQNLRGEKICPATDNTCIITGLTNGVRYRVIVHATNSAGSSIASDTPDGVDSVFATPTPPPPANTLDLGTVAGINLNLIFPVVTADGKVYYHVDHNNNGSATEPNDGVVSDTISSDVFTSPMIDDLVASPGDRRRTTQEESTKSDSDQAVDPIDGFAAGNHDGTDDVRSVIVVDGVNTYSLVVPTVSELNVLRKDPAVTGPAGCVSPCTGAVPENWAADTQDYHTANATSTQNYAFSLAAGQFASPLNTGARRFLALQVIRVSAPAPEALPEALVFSPPTVANRIYPTNVAIPTLTLPEATGGTGMLTYTLTPMPLPTGLTFDATARTLAGTPTTAAAPAPLTYTVTDSANPAVSVSLTFSVSVVTVSGDGDAVADVDGTALAVDNIGTTDHNLRLFMPDDHTATTFRVNTYTPAPATAPSGYIFSGVAMDIDLRPGSADSIPTGTEATVCLSTVGVPDGHSPALFRAISAATNNSGTPTGWDNIGSNIITRGGDEFVCGTTRNFAPFFAVASMPTTPPAPSTPPSFASTVSSLIYQAGVAISPLTLPEASDGSGTLMYTLTPTASIPTDLTFNATARTLTGTPTTAASATLTYTVTDSATPSPQTASLTFSVSVVTVAGDGTPVADEDGTALAVDNVGGENNDVRVSLPGELTTATTLTVTSYTPDANTVPAASYTFSGVAVDIAVTAASIPTGSTATVCLSTAGVPDAHTAALFHDTSGGTGNAMWTNIGEDTTTRTDFVCGTTATFSPFAVASTPTEPSLLLSATDLTLAEGSTTTYTVALAIEPTDTVTVTITSNNSDVTLTPAALTFTIGDWNTAQTMTLTADDDTEQNSATLTHIANGGDYNDVTADLTVTVTGLTLTPTTVTMDEGGTATYTAVLDARPTDAVTVAIDSNNPSVTPTPAALTFTTSNWNTAQTVTLIAAKDDDAANDSATLMHTASGGGYAITANLTATVTDNDTAGLTLNPTDVPMDEGRTANYTAVLDTQPTDTVTVTITSDNTDVTPDLTTLTFTTSDWNTPQTVTLTAAEDDDTMNNFVTLTHAAAGGDYGSASVTRALSVTVTDNDVPNLILTPTTLTLAEGGTATYTVALTTTPSAAVTVTITGYTGTDLAAMPSTMLTFTTMNYNEPQTVTLTAAEDDDAVDEATVTLTHDAMGGDYDADSVDRNLPVTITDNDTAGLTLSAPEVTLAEGGVATYTAVLNTQPTETVTVNIASDNNDVTPTPAALTFTTSNWNTAQTVTLTAAEDDDAADDTVTLTHNASGGEYDNIAADLTVNVTDPDIPGLTLNPTDVPMDEGRTATYTAVLDTQPTETVTVTITSDNTDVTPDLTTLTFTTRDWNTPQTVTLTAAEDDDTMNNTVILTHTAAGGDYGSASVTRALSVTVTDNDAPNLILTPNPMTLDEGGTATYTVALTTMPSAAVTVTITGHTDTDLEATPPSPTTLTFTTMNYNVAQTVPLTAREDVDAMDDNVTLTYTATGGGYDMATGGSSDVSRNLAVIIIDNDTPALILTPTTLTLAQGGTATYTVVLDTEPTDTVTVAIAIDSNNPSVTPTPAALTFAISNWNTAQTVTLKDEDATARNSAILTHTANGGDYRDIIEYLTVNDNLTPTARLNEQILSRASQAMTANVSARVAARVEAAAGSGINSTGDPSALAYQFGGQSSMRGLLQAHGKSMLEGEMDYARLLEGASFVLPLSAAGDEGGKMGGLSLWGGADFSNLEGDTDDLDWEGEVVSFHLGVDTPVGKKMLAGLALSLNTASFDYTNDGEGGDYEYSTTNLHPYFGYMPNEKLNFWGAAGLGQGEIEIKADNAENNAADTSHLSLAGGFSTRLLALSGGKTTLNIKGDVSQTTVDVEANSADGIAAQEVSSNRMRLLLAGKSRRQTASGGTMTPSLESGVRVDGGDGETGTGIELNAGINYTNPNGVSVQGGVHTLFGHDGYSESGADFIIGLSPKSGRGLSLSLQPTWGQTQSTAQRLWDDGINELSGNDKESRSRMDSEVGYGLAATMLGSAGVLTPYAGMTTADGGVSHVRLGGRFAGGTGLRLNLEGARGNGDDASHTVLLRGELAF